MSIALALIACMSCDASTDNTDGGAVDASDDASACGLGDMRRTYYVDGDRDGSGRPGEGAIHSCDLEPPAGFSDDARDCDDSDADKRRERFVDDDGDGYGENASASCVGAAEAGYADRGGDCDDGDEHRSPGATEAWLDGLDSDCDGDDNPSGCFAAPGLDPELHVDEPMPLPDLEAIEVERDESCAGPDLFLAIVSACRACGGGTAVVVVGNRGTEAAGFTVDSGLDSHSSEDDLEPQRLSQPFTLELRSPRSTITLAPALGAADCDRSNDARTLEIGFTDCE